MIDALFVAQKLHFGRMESSSTCDWDTSFLRNYGFNKTNSDRLAQFLNEHLGEAEYDYQRPTRLFHLGLLVSADMDSLFWCQVMALAQ